MADNKKVSKLSRLGSIVMPNDFLYNGEPAQRNCVNVEHWVGKVNVGDQISLPIVEWMLNKKNIELNKKVSRTKHLLALGSIIGCGYFDATVWGSGINTPVATYRAGRRRKRVDFDIRALRGPLTKAALESFGYDCSKCVYGDPGILMPLIYQPENKEKKYDVSVICHFQMEKQIKSSYPDLHFISVKTDDYKKFIDEIAASKVVVSSSLHGIILAESYGVPAVFFNVNGIMDKEIIKYYDWYYSTGRRTVIAAQSIEEALKCEPMEIPDMESMREKLMACFPYDMWEIE